ncbi:MAG: ABC transporter ATP-binding protein [Candidatus Saliniplasma sp.]
MTDKRNTLEIRNLNTFYNHSVKGPEIKAVRDVSFDIKKGEIISLVGESGSGKSTIGMSILNLLPKGTLVDGEILLEGRNILELKGEAIRKIRGKDIAMIFQDPMGRLNALMTIEKHFVEVQQAHKKKISKKEAVERAIEVLDAVGIPPNRIKDYPHEFSGGMRQRIMIALALVFNPKLLIADEATTSLDVVVQSQILEMMEDLTDKFNVSVLNITHNLGVVAEISDRVGVLYGGKLVEIGTADEIFHDPKHPYTKGLIDSVIELDSDSLVWIDGAPPDLSNPPKGCPFEERCELSGEICDKKYPVETGFSQTHRAACHKIKPEE